VANLWGGHGLKPQKQGTFKLSKDPRSWTRSPTSSASTWTRPAARSCWASMRRPRS